MTIAIDPEWAATRRPTRGGGLDPWEGRLADLSVLRIERLEAAVSSTEQTLQAALGRIEGVCPGSTGCGRLRAGRTRLRPLLALLASELGDLDRAECVVAATCIELTHLGLIWHDHVIPGGGPECAEDDRSAILAGDMFYAEACKLGVDLGAESLLAVSGGISQLTEGQLRAAAGPAPDEDAFEHYLSITSARSGALLTTSVRLGGLAGCTAPIVLDAMTAAVDRLALAAQLADDVIEVREHMELDLPIAPNYLEALLVDRDDAVVLAQAAMTEAADAARTALQQIPSEAVRHDLVTLVDQAIRTGD